MADCVFCGRTFKGTGRSGEHVFPRWLEKYVTGPVPRGRGYDGVRVGSLAGDKGFSVARRKMPITAFEQKTRRVCTECNTGWMERRIETNARDALIPIFEGERPRLTYRRQEAMAAWAWKTAAMITLLTEKADQAVSAEEYQWFYDRRKPPPRSMVWAGAYERRSHVEWWDTWTSSVDRPEVRDVYSVPFTVANVFFLVFGTSASSLSRGTALGPLGPLRARLAPLWPTRPGAAFDWPPGDTVDDAMIDRLGNSFWHLGAGRGLEAGVQGDVYGVLA